jgi:hypothetical protein
MVLDEEMEEMGIRDQLTGLPVRKRYESNHLYMYRPACIFHLRHIYA